MSKPARIRSYSTTPRGHACTAAAHSGNLCTHVAALACHACHTCPCISPPPAQHLYFRAHDCLSHMHLDASKSHPPHLLKSTHTLDPMYTAPAAVRVVQLPHVQPLHQWHVTSYTPWLPAVHSLPWPTPPHPSGQPYAIPQLTYKDIWVDPVAGRDDNAGTGPTAAFKTFAKAWAAVPAGVALTQPTRIRIMNGTVPASGVPQLWEKRWAVEARSIESILRGGGGITRAMVLASCCGWPGWPCIWGAAAQGCIATSALQLARQREPPRKWHLGTARCAAPGADESEQRRMLGP